MQSNIRLRPDKAKLKTRSLGDLLDADFPPQDYLLEPLLRQGESLLIADPFGSAAAGPARLRFPVALAVLRRHPRRRGRPGGSPATSRAGGPVSQIMPAKALRWSGESASGASPRASRWRSNCSAAAA